MNKGKAKTLLQRKRTIKNKLCFGFAALFAATFISFSSAQAACTNPAGGAGKIIYNADDEVMQYCDDTNWIAMGPVPGAGGAGCSNPAGGAGKLLYNTDSSTMQYCDGGSWVAMGPIATPTTSGLVAHWEFDETSGTTADDSTGNSDNDGTLINSPEWSPGVIGGSLFFDSTNYVDIPNADQVGAVSHVDTFGGGTHQTTTISVWTRITIPSSPSAWDGVLGSIAANNYMSWMNGGTNDRQMRMMTQNFDSGTANYFPISDGAMTWDTWWHTVYVVEDGVGYQVYFNGELDKDVAFTDINLGHWGCNGANGCNIGTFRVSDTDKFDGFIDDLRVYNRKLTPGEVKTLYNYGAARISNAPTSGLVGHWKLDETSGSSIADSAGSNTGTWADGADNNVSGETTTGIVARALDFDGSNDGIDISSNAAYGTTSFTTSAWVYIDGSIPAGWKTIIEHNRGGTNQYGLWKSSNSTSFHCRWTEDGAGQESADFNTTISADTWYHVACTYDEATDTANMYLNGSLDNTVPSTGASLTSNADVITIGKNNADGEQFDGIIDDVRVYNRALSPSEIAGLYQYRGGTLSGCTSPAGTPGKMIYNADDNIMQYCNGVKWIGIGK